MNINTCDKTEKKINWVMLKKISDTGKQVRRTSFAVVRDNFQSQIMLIKEIVFKWIDKTKWHILF